MNTNETPEPTEFGTYLRSLRKERKMTKADVERAVGVDRSFLFRLESGKAKTGSIETLTKLAQAYGLAQGDLLRMAGITLNSEGLPGLRPYLRQTQGLGVDDSQRVEEFIDFIRTRRSEDPAGSSNVGDTDREPTNNTKS
jgi:transcriptional regulator with XRE-family HTH domain